MHLVGSHTQHIYTEHTSTSDTPNCNKLETENHVNNVYYIQKSYKNVVSNSTPQNINCNLYSIFTKYGI